MKRVCLFIVATLFLSIIAVGCGKQGVASPEGLGDVKLAPQAEPSTLFPLKVGMKWEMKPELGDNNHSWSGHEKHEVTKLGRKRGVTCFEIKTHRLTSGEVTGTTTLEYVTVTTDGYYLLGTTWWNQKDNRPAEEHWYDPPICILQPHRAGAISSWNEDSLPHKWDYNEGKKYIEMYKNIGASVQSPVKVTVGGQTCDSTSVRRERKSILTSETWYLVGVGPIKTRYFDPQTNADRGGNSVDSIPEVVSTKIGDVSLSSQEIEREGKPEPVELKPGVTQTITKKKMLRREITYATNKFIGGEIEGKLAAQFPIVRAELNVKVQGSYQTATRQHYVYEEELTSSVTVDGNISPNAQIIWVDVYRTGTADIVLEGKTFKVPFEFPVSTRLKVK